MWNKILDIIFGPEPKQETVIYVELKRPWHDAYWELRQELGREPSNGELIERRYTA